MSWRRFCIVLLASQLVGGHCLVIGDCSEGTTSDADVLPSSPTLLQSPVMATSKRSPVDG